MNQQRKVIIDTDPGVDDAIAILLALASPDLEILGLTSVGGNVPRARATRNALVLLEYARRGDVPVAAGGSRPLRGKFPYAYHFHGKGGLSRRLPEPRTKAIAAGAVDFLAEQLRRHPKQIDLVALGPLTNLARLERRHPG
ncbi:MAG: nucleoside hydrolase, partial [Dehalococcoidia bacterium]